MLTTLAITNYRSIRRMVLPLGPLNVVTGANGSGKSNLYKALRLLSDTARGGVISTLAREGGLDSTLWAGPEVLSRRMKTGDVPVQGGPRQEPVNLRLGFCDDAVGYSIDIGLPIPSSSLFSRDPEIKRECIFAAPSYRPSGLLAERRNAMSRVRDDSHEWVTLSAALSSFDSMLFTIADARLAPEVVRIRDLVTSWRFYDHFRADADAPALAEAVDDAFPGASVRVRGSEGGHLALEFSQPGLLRPLSAAELSDGTLRYLLWVAALLTPRPPTLMVLNEPETSLHPDLLPALGRLIIRASRGAQVWVVSHASRLVAALKEAENCQLLQLDKELGESVIQGLGTLDEPPWKWPER